MWGGCVGHSTLKLQGSKVDEEWDELVCVMPHCMQQKQCARCTNKRSLSRGHNNVHLARTTFPRDALFCVKWQKSMLSIAEPSLACLPVIYIPSPLTTNSTACCKVWVFLNTGYCKLLNEFPITKYEVCSRLRSTFFFKETLSKTFLHGQLP